MVKHDIFLNRAGKQPENHTTEERFLLYSYGVQGFPSIHGELEQILQLVAEVEPKKSIIVREQIGRWGVILIISPSHMNI